MAIRISRITITIMAMRKGQGMTKPGALVRLMTMLSPAFPVGAFSFSSGLEQAAADRLVIDEATLGAWLGDMLRVGALWNDAVLLAESWRCARSADALAEINELAVALAGSAGRHTETTAQGAAFLSAAKQAWPTPELPDEAAYPVAVGAVAARIGVEIDTVLPIFLNAAVTNQVQAAIRLSLTGQNGGVRLLAALEPVILEIAGRASTVTLDDLGSATFVAEISAMNHETLGSRIFRT